MYMYLVFPHTYVECRQGRIFITPGHDLGKLRLIVPHRTQFFFAPQQKRIRASWGAENFRRASRASSKWDSALSKFGPASSTFYS